MASRVIIRRVLFARDQEFRMKEVLVLSISDLVDHGRLQIDVHASGHVLGRAPRAVTLVEERGHRAVLVADRLLGRDQTAIGLNAVLQTEELPARVADLGARLTNVDRNAFSLTEIQKRGVLTHGTCVR